MMSLKDIRTISCYVCIFWLQQAPQRPCHTPSTCAPSPKDILVRDFLLQKEYFPQNLGYRFVQKKKFPHPLMSLHVYNKVLTLPELLGTQTALELLQIQVELFVDFEHL